MVVDQLKHTVCTYVYIVVVAIINTISLFLKFTCIRTYVSTFVVSIVEVSVSDT